MGPYGTALLGARTLTAACFCGSCIEFSAAVAHCGAEWSTQCGGRVAEGRNCMDCLTKDLNTMCAMCSARWQGHHCGMSATAGKTAGSSGAAGHHEGGFLLHLLCSSRNAGHALAQYRLAALGQQRLYKWCAWPASFVRLLIWLCHVCNSTLWHGKAMRARSIGLLALLLTGLYCSQRDEQGSGCKRIHGIAAENQSQMTLYACACFR
jgi:hypothetical protein